MALVLLAWALGSGPLGLSGLGPRPGQHDNQAYGPKDKVLDLGIQPLSVPTSAITEAMRRNGVLRREMARLADRVSTRRGRPEGNNSYSGQLDGLLAGGHVRHQRRQPGRGGHR